MVIIPAGLLVLREALQLLAADERTTLGAEVRALDNPDRAGVAILGFYNETMVRALAAGELVAVGLVVGPLGDVGLYTTRPVPPEAWRSGKNAHEALRKSAPSIAALFDPGNPKHSAGTVCIFNIEYLPLFRPEEVLAWAKSLRREPDYKPSQRGRPPKGMPALMDLYRWLIAEKVLTGCGGIAEAKILLQLYADEGNDPAGLPQPKSVAEAMRKLMKAEKSAEKSADK